MSNCTSKIGNHVYVNGGADAVKLYKKAFELDETDGAWLDDDGYIIHRQLERNGELFLSVSEDIYLPDESINKCPVLRGKRQYIKIAPRLNIMNRRA